MDHFKKLSERSIFFDAKIEQFENLFFIIFSNIVDHEMSSVLCFMCKFEKKMV